jgi:hypothetical protein
VRRGVALAVDVERSSRQRMVMHGDAIEDAHLGGVGVAYESFNAWI